MNVSLWYTPIFFIIAPPQLIMILYCSLPNYFTTVASLSVVWVLVLISWRFNTTNLDLKYYPWDHAHLHDEQWVSLVICGNIYIYIYVCVCVCDFSYANNDNLFSPVARTRTIYNKLIVLIVVHPIGNTWHCFKIGYDMREIRRFQ